MNILGLRKFQGNIIVNIILDKNKSAILYKPLHFSFGVWFDRHSSFDQGTKRKVLVSA